MNGLALVAAGSILVFIITFFVAVSFINFTSVSVTPYYSTYKRIIKLNKNLLIKISAVAAILYFLIFAALKIIIWINFPTIVTGLLNNLEGNILLNYILIVFSGFIAVYTGSILVWKIKLIVQKGINANTSVFARENKNQQKIIFKYSSIIALGFAIIIVITKLLIT